MNKAIFWVSVATAVGCGAAACSSSTTDGGAGLTNAGGNAGAMVGFAGDVSGGAGGNAGAMVGFAGDVSGGAGGDAGTAGKASGEDCTLSNATLIPALIEADVKVGPGCLTVETTRMEDGGTLTIAAGSTVLMQTDASLSTGDQAINDSTASLIAVGTAAEPIVFTSAKKEPAPGDWQCVLLSQRSAGSRLDHVVLEYGGRACGNAHKESLLVVNGAARVDNTSLSHSSSLGALLAPVGPGPRSFDNVSFASNEAASLQVGSTKLPALGATLSFADADDVIEVDGSYLGVPSGTWRKEPVPYKLLGSIEVQPEATVNVEPGVEIRIPSGKSIEASGALHLVGTEADPIVLTSAEPKPAAGDWSCLVLRAGSRIEHAVLEYAGAGSGCTGADYKTAVWTDSAIEISDVKFRDIAGAAVISRVQCSDTATATEWCANTHENVSGAAAFTCETQMSFCP